MMVRSISILIILVACDLALGNAADTVAMFKGNTQLTGHYNAAAVYHLSGVKFTFKTNGPIRSTPAIYNDVLYFGSGDGFLYAVDAETGKERWRFYAEAPIYSSPAVAGGQVWFVSANGVLHALQASDGKEVWQYKMGKDLTAQNYWDYYHSSPNIDNDILYVGSGDGNLYSFNTKTKKLNWKYNSGSRIRSTPAVSDNLVVFGTMSGYVVAIDKNTGQLRWKFATQGASYHFYDVENDRTSVFCSPAIANGTVLIGARDGFLYALDLATGNLKWKFDHQGSWVLSTSIEGDKAYVGSGSAYFIQSLDLQTGKELWRFKTQSANFSSITIAGDVLYSADFSGNIYALDRLTGKEKWCFPLGNRALSTPVVSDGMVYCSSDGGVLYALQGSTIKDTGVVRARKGVYYEGMKTDTAFQWFQNGTDLWIRNYFVSAGYTLLNTQRLLQFMQQTKTDSSSVIVFADNKIPSEITKQNSGTSILRNYLNEGGKLVLLGPNPLAYKADSLTGVLDTVDYARCEKVFGIKYPAFNEMMGYYGFQLTDYGKKLGLTDFNIGTSAIDPAQATTVLAINDYGLASEWIKNYGGPPGSGLMQLLIPRFAAGENVFPLRAAIECGINW